MIDKCLNMPICVKPYKHQIEAFNFACKHFGLLKEINVSPYERRSRGVAYLMEMGTGKSLTSVGVAGALFEAGKINKALIVAPLSILSVWKNEFEKFANFGYDLEILKGTAEQKIKILKNLQGDFLNIAVVNYESAWRIEKEILDWKPQLIIADESHKLKTHTTKASKTMHKLGAAASYRLMLTGTIITNKAIDVFSQYKFLNPDIFGMSFYAFRNRYFDMVGYGNYTPVLKKSMQSVLNGKVLSIAYCVTKEECLDLPEKTDVIRVVELEPKAAKLYNKLVKDSYAELEKGEVIAKNVLTKILRLSQVTGGFISGGVGGKTEKVSNAKLEALEDIIESITQEGGKIVIIARFLAEIKAICKLLEAKNIKYACIYGEIKNREEQVRQFQRDPATTVFIGQIATAGLGITLTSASTLVFYSFDYSYANFEQTKARIHRVGQKNKCTYIYLMAKDTIDFKVLQVLKQKENLAQTLIDTYKLGVNPFEQKGR